MAAPTTWGMATNGPHWLISGGCAPRAMSAAMPTFAHAALRLLPCPPTRARVHSDRTADHGCNRGRAGLTGLSQLHGRHTKEPQGGSVRHDHQNPAGSGAVARRPLCIYDGPVPRTDWLGCLHDSYLCDDAEWLLSTKRCRPCRGRRRFRLHDHRHGRRFADGGHAMHDHDRDDADRPCHERSPSMLGQVK
jgi:hypothetical protein